MTRERPNRIRGYVAVNPNFTAHALSEIRTGAAAGMIGVKLAASRRANDPLLDPVASLAGRARLPLLHHIWQHRRREYAGQEASDAGSFASSPIVTPRTSFILAHIGGGGDWLHSLQRVRDVPNVYVDLSGSGVDGGMLELCVARVGVERLLWGADITMCTGWAKLRYLEHVLPAADMEHIRWRNAARIFPPEAFMGAA
jgi:predicted TIM-barrel fold metal-dependent hydrolase